MIFACLHWLDSLPSSSNAWNRSRTLFLTAGQVIFQTIAGRLSSPGAFQDFALNSCCSTSSIVMAGILTGALCGLAPSFLMLFGRGGKNLASSSSACSLWSVVVVPSAWMSCGTFLNAVLSPDFRYLVAFYMLLLSARNSFQWFFFYCWMASWYCFAALLAVSSRCDVICPACCSKWVWFLQYV